MAETLFCSRFRIRRLRRLCSVAGHRWKQSFDVEVCRRCGAMRRTPGWLDA